MGDVLSEKKADRVLGKDDGEPERLVEKGTIFEEGRQSYDIAISKDGLKLHPQPTADPLDPLNWSFAKKHTILAIVMYLYAALSVVKALLCFLNLLEFRLHDIFGWLTQSSIRYFMFTYITTTTVPSFPELQESLGISYSQVNWTVAIPALGLAFGPLFWSSLADIYGRRIIFIIGTVIALAATIGAGGAKQYGGYMAARFFQGFGVSPAATVGMAVISDMFFEYERGQKLGLWVLALDAGLLVGPIISGFIDLVSPEWIQWLTAIMFALLLVLELVFMSETLYPRNTMLRKLPLAVDADRNDIEKLNWEKADANQVDLKRTKQLFFFNLKPVPGMRHPKPWDSVLRFIFTFKYPVVVIGVFTYCFAWYWWILSVITMLPAAYLQYSPQIQGLLFIGLLLGTLFSEIFCSGRLSDFIVMKLAKKNSGVRVPEMRLWLAYPAALLSAVGLIIWGVSIDKGYHWIVGQIAFFIFAAGIQIGNTVITSYIVDSYPLQSMSVITFYAVLINLSAFVNPFFIAPWETASGFTWTFAAQGIITFFVSVPIFAALHKFGPSLRAKAGHPSWVNPEHDS